MGGRWGAYLEDRDHYILLLSPSEIYHMEFYLMSLCLKHCFPLHKLQVAHDVYELLELSLWYLVFWKLFIFPLTPKPPSDCKHWSSLYPCRHFLYPPLQFYFQLIYIWGKGCGPHVIHNTRSYIDLFRALLQKCQDRWDVRVHFILPHIQDWHIIIFIFILPTSLCNSDSLTISCSILSNTSFTAWIYDLKFLVSSMYQDIRLSIPYLACFTSVAYFSVTCFTIHTPSHSVPT